MLHSELVVRMKGSSHDVEVFNPSPLTSRRIV